MSNVFETVCGISEDWRPSLSDKMDMIEILIDEGSVYGMSINEALDSKEARRAAALAIAARELHAEPAMDSVKAHRSDTLQAKDKDAEEDGRDYSNRWDDIQLQHAHRQTASKMMAPDTLTRGVNSKVCPHKNPRFHRSKHPLSPCTAYRVKSPIHRTTHVNPVETGKDYIFAGHSHATRKIQQDKRNAADADKILGKGGKEGYGYSTNRAIPHIQAKIAAHKEEDDKAWSHADKMKFDREWQANQDAKAMRVHGKTQFADNHKQYHTIGTVADDIPKEYADRLHKNTITYKQHNHDDNEKDGTEQGWGVKHEIDAHRARIHHYNDKAQAEKNNRHHELSDDVKYHRERDQWKTDRARGHKPGDTIDMGKKWRKNSKTGEYEVTDEPDTRVMGKEPKPLIKKRQGKDVRRKKTEDDIPDYTKDIDYIPSYESCNCVKTVDQLNPNIHTPNIDSLLRELRQSLRKTVKTENDVLSGAFPSKYGKGKAATSVAFPT
jgi:hypothetical protein